MLIRSGGILLLAFASCVVLGAIFAGAEEDDDELNLLKPVAKVRKSRTTPATTPKPKHEGKHKLVSKLKPGTKPKKLLKDKKFKKKPLAGKGSKSIGQSMSSGRDKRSEDDAESTPEGDPPADATPAAPTEETPKETSSQEESPPPEEVNPESSKDEAPATTEGAAPTTTKEEAPATTAKTKSPAQPRAVLAPAAGEGEDPFSLSPAWALFNRRMDNLTIMLLEQMKPVYSIFTENPDYKTAAPDTFIKDFNEKYLNGIIKLLTPAKEELVRNQAYTVVNPAINLRTISEAMEFGKTNPSGENDQGRLKWMEVNSMAGTIHHIYKRVILSNFETGGLEEVNRTMGIPYPSWVTASVTKDEGDKFDPLRATELTSYVHEQMNILGEKDHLIRILERLLNNTALSNWNPDDNPLNVYCFGNNQNGQIHKKFDVLQDAALYLCLADMEFAILEMISAVHKAWKAEEGGEPVDLEATRTEIEKTLKARVERKYRIATPIGDEGINVIAPTKFKCDLPPKSCEESPHATAPNCPPGVYIQDGSIFNNGTKIEIPEGAQGIITDADGKTIDCIGLEHVPYNPEGVMDSCIVENGKCVDLTTGEPKEGWTVKVTPVLLDENKVPVIRTKQTPVYPGSGEWGILDCGIHPDLPGPDPPEGEHTPKTPEELKEDEEKGGKLPSDFGYDDPRKPDATGSAQFTNAYPGYLESELALNPEGKCVGTCRNYKHATKTCPNNPGHCDLYRKSHCEGDDPKCMAASKCTSAARRCIRASREVTFCPSSNETARVYDWIKLGDQAPIIVQNSTDETKLECSGNTIMKLKERWEMESGVILNTPQYCELCLCVCNDPITPEGKHFFDISPRLSNTEGGFVVTGLRFEQKDNTISLNIQEGKLGNEGKIDPSTLKWLEPNESPERVPLGSTGFMRLNLDEVIAKFTEVVTGIRWKHDGLSLSLEAGVTEYISEPPSASSKVEFISAKSQVKMRQKFDLTETLSPLNQAGPSQPYPITEGSKYFIEFDATSLEKDAGQAVVPFFDLQPLLSSETNPVPLSSVGILYKSKSGSGGFLAPTLRTYVHPYIRE